MGAIKPLKDLTKISNEYIDVLEKLEAIGKGHYKWRIFCHACEREGTLTTTGIKNGAKSCGCRRNNKKVVYRSDETFKTNSSWLRKAWI